MKEKKNYETPAFVLGLIGLFVSWIPFFGIILPVIAFTLGLKSEVKSGLNTAGIILGGIGLGISILATLLTLFSLLVLFTI